MKRILKYISVYKKKIIFIVIIMIVSTGINFILPILNKKAIDDGLLKNDISMVIKVTILILVLVIIDQCLGLIEVKLSTYVGNMFNYKLSSIAVRKLINIDMGYINNKNFTEIMNNIDMDIRNITKIVDESFVMRIFNIFKIIGGFIALISIDYRLSIIILLIIPLKYIITKHFTEIRKTYYKKYMDYYKEYSKWYGDKLAGIKEIQLLGIEDSIMKQFTIWQRKIIKTDIKSRIIDSSNMCTDIIFLQFISAFIYIFGGFLILRKTFTLGGLFAFSTYSFRVIQQTASLFNIKYDMAKILLSSKRLFDFLDKVTSKELSSSDKKCIRVSKDQIQGNIEFRNIHFSYSKGNEVLKDISFNISKGEKVAIIGLNGSGKSTLLDILLKIYEPSHGEVYIDGIDIKNINTRDLRKNISVINQNSYIFNGSIRENVALFKSTPDERINELLKLSGAYDFVDELDDGIEAELGNNGSNFSGGEKQKLIISRALFKKSNIVILDEATSNIDLKSENQLNQLFLNEFKENTIIFITHRPYVLKELNKIIVLDKGIIESIGTHEELVRWSKTYMKIIKEQSSLVI
ncbi:ABC transporter ATP-binding protein [Clostridium sp. UBA1056]|uniref:ABC transporter ATP-binding protein n=1 Tax=unclassified Clostridium TaxID=2614128 RepID=UPI0032172F1A